MKSFSSAEARKNFADIINRAAYGSEHIAIKRSGKELAYLISAKDYKLFQQLLQQIEDDTDINIADSRISDSKQQTMSFEEFFADLEDQI